MSVSDWHTFNKKAETAVKALQEDYQAVVLLGDCAPGLMSERDIAEYILAFGYSLTGGTIPVIYTRGNHETRGSEAIRLSDYLGLDSFYFTTALGLMISLFWTAVRIKRMHILNMAVWSITSGIVRNGGLA